MPAMNTGKTHHHIIDELTSVVGAEAALQIVNRFSGKDIRFIGEVANELDELIGRDGRYALRKYFKGVEVYIPMQHALKREAKKRALVARFDELSRTMSARKSVTRLAEEFGYANRTVWSILKKSGAPNPQQES